MPQSQQRIIMVHGHPDLGAMISEMAQMGCVVILIGFVTQGAVRYTITGSIYRS